MKSIRDIELQIPEGRKEALTCVPTGMHELDAVGVNPYRLTPMQAIVLTLVGGNVRITESGTPIDTRIRGSVIKEAVEEAAKKLDAGEKVESLNMGIVAEYQHLKKLGAFKLDMGRKSIRDQIREAPTTMEVNLIYASALLDKFNMKRRTWKSIERAREVRLQELASLTERARLSERVPRG